ncbi:Holliday junction resolvase RuvX [Succinivibrio dextrinosolvens]|uniref:Holliday junction resolvase RuvX n=1 Tax=Succinivibrio dextrinosolvens TaxID=83771 RepID=UPI0004E1B835|nr:Holliday junction resolvase RuvX [Succinivibrio dextrinosolvens]
MSTILAFDFGLHHIGVATGNTTTKTCSPQKSIQARDGIPNADALDKLVRDWLPAVFVVGLPLNMDGTEQEMTFKARKFGNRLKEKYKKEVFFIDERLTSASAKEEIFERGGFRALAKDKGAIDSLSAVTILEQYFSEHV